MPHEIWKFPLNTNNQQIVMMPDGAELLDIQFQGSELCVWALIKPKNPLIPVSFRIIGTGWPIEDITKLYHIKTVQQGIHVWHIFTEAVEYAHLHLANRGEDDKKTTN